MIKSIKKKVLNENYNLHIFNLIIYKKFIKLCFKKEIAVNEKVILILCYLNLLIDDIF